MGEDENSSVNATSALRMVLRGAHLQRACWVALLVGSALNLINQPEALLGSAPVIWWKLAMTYCVPFLVASYGAYAALRHGAGN